MGRTQFNDGQEVRHADLSLINANYEAEFYDRVLQALMSQKQNGFWGNGFFVAYSSSSSITLKAGLGIQYDSTQTSPEPKNRPIYTPNDSAHSITTPDATHNRIDIVCVQSGRNNLLTANRNFKDAGTGAISSVAMVLSTDWGYNFQIVAGTPSASPAVPATPSGWIKVAEITVTASTGIASQAAIVDARTHYTNYPQIYSGIIGSLAYCTHADINAFDADFASGGVGSNKGVKALVVQSLTPAVTQILYSSYVVLEFLPGVGLVSGGGATVGLQINGNGNHIIRPKLTGFATGIVVNDGPTWIKSPWFSGCTADISGASAHGDKTICTDPYST